MAPIAMYSKFSRSIERSEQILPLIRKTLLKEIEGRVLARGRLIGTFERK